MEQNLDQYHGETITGVVLNCPLPFSHLLKTVLTASSLCSATLFWGFFLQTDGKNQHKQLTESLTVKNVPLGVRPLAC